MCTTDPILVRWLTFNAVGAIGCVVQLACLWLLLEVIRLPYLIATVAAVELTVLHNFVWHLRWTWKNRRVPSSALMWRLLRFNASNGAFSIAGNVVLMAAFLRFLPGHHLLANLASIGICSLVNFAICDRWTFKIPNPNGGAHFDLEFFQRRGAEVAEILLQKRKTLRALRLCVEPLTHLQRGPRRRRFDHE